MSFAAPYPPSGARSGSLLPAIKCSQCNEEIEIAAMGEHICGRAASPTPRSYASAPTNPFTLRQTERTGPLPPFAPSPSYAAPRSRPQSPAGPPPPRARAPTLTSGQNAGPGAGSRPPRLPLPKINPDAANRPFLTPAGAPLQVPLSPAVSLRSASSNEGRPGMPRRSATSPRPRIYDPRPPSPELSANLDCAFPPWPKMPAATKEKERRPSMSSGRSKTPTGSDRAPSRGGSRLDQVINAEPSEPKSPKSTGGEGVLKRMNTLKNGPFSFGRRRPSEASVVEPPPRPSTASSNYSSSRRPSVPTLPADLMAGPKQPPTRPARPTNEVLSPTFLDKLSTEPGSLLPSAASPPASVTMSDGSNTFQFADESPDSNGSPHPLSRMQSAPDMREGARRPALRNGPVSEPSQVLQAQSIAPRTASRDALRMDLRLDNAPPVPFPAQPHRQDSAHAPSKSASSTSSTDNSLSNSSSTGPSPTGSAASSIETYSPLSYDSNQYGDRSEMRPAGLSLNNTRKNPGMRAEQTTSASPAKNFARPMPLSDESQSNETPTPGPMESPMDPTFGQQSRPAYQPWKPTPAPYAAPPALVRSQTSPPKPFPAALPPQSALASPARDVDPFRPASPMTRSNTSPPAAAAASYQSLPPLSATAPAQAGPMAPPPVPKPAPMVRRPSRRPTVSKANCRGCGLVIEGKSVKAADGRLTGRWHKSCFVCRTCTQPFTTADFYVIDNEPYCEQHYHEHNGSLCHGCHRGIEGQFLETSSTTTGPAGATDKKFHPRCFTCCECREVLADDYFEILGRVFCERHAFAAMRAQARKVGPAGLAPPNPRGFMAERRTTKMMNMA